MYLPPYIQTALEILKQHGASGYAVGGCVRDALLGLTPHDYDIAVSVPPEETMACFAGYRVIGTGLKHGTVTVVLDGHNVEMTSFRTDGEYTDLRRPEHVRFTPDLAEDLSRRDFTVNAMAYSPDAGLVDLFGGQEDLKNRVLRCVGVPEDRFREDGLRILRALRFASVLGFAVEPETDLSVRRNAGNLTFISAERKLTELRGLLKGVYAKDVLLRYRDVINVCIPALQTLNAEEYAAAAAAAGGFGDDTTGFAALTFPLGADVAENACRDLKADNKFRTAVRFCTEHRDDKFATPGAARRFAGANGKEKCLLLARFRTAYGIDSTLLTDVCREADVLPGSIAQLSVGGREMAALGLRGPEIGEALEYLLALAADGAVPNEPAALLKAAKDKKTGA